MCLAYYQNLTFYPNSNGDQKSMGKVGVITFKKRHIFYELLVLSGRVTHYSCINITLLKLLFDLVVSIDSLISSHLIFMRCLCSTICDC